LAFYDSAAENREVIPLVQDKFCCRVVRGVKLPFNAEKALKGLGGSFLCS